MDLTEDTSVRESEILVAARVYVARGFFVVPIPPGRNRPLQEGWQDLRLIETELPEYFAAAGNIGLLLSPSGLVDIDCDCHEAAAAARILLPGTGMVHGHASNLRSHLYYKSSSTGSNTPFRDPRHFGTTSDRSTLVEFRVHGQTVVPPSTNLRSGEPVRWDSDGEPADADGDALLCNVAKVASAALIARYWPRGSRHHATMALSGMLLRSGWGNVAVETFITAVVDAAQDEENAGRLRDIVSTSRRLEQRLPATGTPTLVQIIGADIVEKVNGWLKLSVPNESTETVAFHHTDLGNAQRLVAAHGEDLRFDCHSGRWLFWDGCRWAYDGSGHVERLAKDAVKQIYSEANNSPRHDDRTMLIKHALKSEAEGRIRAMVNLAKSESDIVIGADKLDAGEMLLNCTNGVLDLETGNLLAHAREFLCTKNLNIPFDKDASCPRWFEFLDQIFERNQSLINFLQRAVGYSLTGKTIEQVLFLLYGTGANGKTTFIEIMKALLGPYAKQANFETFLAAKMPSNHNDLARFQGARFVAAVEAGEGRTLDETIVKQVTGGDSITTRFLYKEYFEFRPQLKLWLVANDKPRVVGTDEAIWRRIRLVPFNVTIPPSKRDKQLLEKLMAELTGILAWAVEGCLDWQKHGLGEPVEVQEATSQYRTEMDTLESFMNERCERGAQYSVLAANIYDGYKKWCEFTLEHPMTQQKFGLRLRKMEFTSTRLRGQRYWQGIRFSQVHDADGSDVVDVDSHQPFQ
jgi:putative DNA primase/helicase